MNKQKFSLGGLAQFLALVITVLALITVVIYAIAAPWPHLGIVFKIFRILFGVIAFCIYGGFLFILIRDRKEFFLR